MQGAETPEAVEEGLRALIEEIGHQLPLLDAQRVGAELYGAPRLSPYELFRPNENALSRIIADLFDPRGTHGQGPLFLNALLDALGLPRVRLRDVVNARCEVLTSEDRRIDIVIDTPATLLGIENKPWAGQQENQLSHYHDELKVRAKGRRFELVFLSDQEEKSAQGKVIRMPYHAADQKLSLHKVLSSTVSSVRAARTRVHMKDLLRYMELEFGKGAMNDEGDEIYVEAVRAEFDVNSKGRRTLATVLLAQTALHEQILSEISQFLLNRVNEEMNSIHYSAPNMRECLKDKWEPWSVSQPLWPSNCSVALQAEKDNFCSVQLGIRALKPGSVEAEKHPASVCELRSKLETKKADLPISRHCNWWLCLRSVSDQRSLRCWNSESVARFVLHSESGRVADHPEIKKLAQQMVELVKYVEEIVRG